MRLDFIGTHHYNPRHRERLLQAYESLLHDVHKGEPPRFLAVESGEAHFEHIREVERPILREEVQKEWRQAPPPIWNRLAATIHFEADAHRDGGSEQIRDARIIWLDDGDPRDPHGIAGRWLNVLRERIRREPLTQADQSDLEDRIAIACAAVDRDEERSEDKKDRDIGFAHRILNEVKANEAGWAAIAVGKVHAV